MFLCAWCRVVSWTDRFPLAVASVVAGGPPIDLKGQSMHRRQGLALLAAPVLLSATAAADLTVGDLAAGADFATPQEAVDAASEGETIWIQAGEYPHATIDGKSIRLIALTPGTVVLSDTTAAAGTSTALIVRNLSATQRVFVSGLETVRNVLESPFGAGELRRGALEVVDSEGWVELLDVDCNLNYEAAYGDDSGAHVENGKLIAVASDFLASDVGDTPGMRAVNATLISNGCRFVGAEGDDSAYLGPYGEGEVGLVLESSLALIENGVFVGGNGKSTIGTSWYYSQGSAGIRAVDSSLRITGPQSCVVGGDSPLIIDPPFFLAGGSAIEISGITSFASIGNAVVLAPGSSIEGVVADDVTLDDGAGFTVEAGSTPTVATTSMRVGVGDSFSVEYSGEPSANVTLLFSGGLAEPLFLPFSAHPAVLDPAGLLNFGVVTLDAAGQAQSGLTVPPNPSLTGFVGWLQVYDLGSQQLSLPTAVLVGP